MTSRALPLFRHVHEPDESRLDIVNQALDRIEVDARTVVDAGGEVALRTRRSRVLGDAPVPAARRMSSESAA